MLAGAIVRATGSGMGCPDWPRCWGCLIPPTSIDQVDFESLDIERFQIKAERAGRDPNEITLEALQNEFNPTHTWIEFINRCLSLPLGFSSLALLILSFAKKDINWLMKLSALVILFLILLAAWLGAKIVYSGLQPGTITTHMAIAMLLLVILAFVISYGGDRSFIKKQPTLSTGLSSTGVALLFLTLAEGILGSQVRELTDELGKAYPEGDRSEWSEILQHSTVYLIHRSFSWIIFFLGIALAWMSHKQGTLKFFELSILGIVFAQMIMGVVLSHFGVFGAIQVLHVFASALLLASNVFWAFNRRLRLLGKTH